MRWPKVNFMNYCCWWNNNTLTSGLVMQDYLYRVHIILYLRIRIENVPKWCKLWSKCFLAWLVRFSTISMYLLPWFRVCDCILIDSPTAFLAHTNHVDRFPFLQTMGQTKDLKLFYLLQLAKLNFYVPFVFTRRIRRYGIKWSCI